MPKIRIENMIRGNHQIVRSVNRAVILNVIRSQQPISRIQLAKITGLNKSTVSSIISDLLDENLIYEESGGESTGGRPPVLMRLQKRVNLVGAIDFDPGQTMIAIADIEGEVLRKRSLSTRADTVEPFVGRCIEQLQELKREVGAPTLRGIGVSVPGIVDARSGFVQIAPDLGWQHVNLKPIFEARLDPAEPVIFQNEANAAALAELWFDPVVADRSNIVFVSEGIGTGIIFDGKLVEGSFNGAGQFGHMTIQEQGERCVCGNRGCWEVYASKQATVQRYQTLSGRTLAGTSEAQLETILDLAERGDRHAIAAIQETGRYLGIGISNIVKGIDPEVIVLGGAITRTWDLIYPHIMDEVRSRVFFKLRKNVRIVPTSLKERTSLLGAATLVIKEVFGGYKITR